MPFHIHSPLAIFRLDQYFVWSSIFADRFIDTAGVIDLFSRLL